MYAHTKHSRNTQILFPPRAQITHSATEIPKTREEHVGYVNMPVCLFAVYGRHFDFDPVALDKFVGSLERERAGKTRT
jgi:hypothetical protein